MTQVTCTFNETSAATWLLTQTLANEEQRSSEDEDEEEKKKEGDQEVDEEYNEEELEEVSARPARMFQIRMAFILKGDRVFDDRRPITSCPTLTTAKSLAPKATTTWTKPFTETFGLLPW